MVLCNFKSDNLESVDNEVCFSVAGSAYKTDGSIQTTTKNSIYVKGKNLFYAISILIGFFVEEISLLISYWIEVWYEIYLLNFLRQAMVILPHVYDCTSSPCVSSKKKSIHWEIITSYNKAFKNFSIGILRESWYTKSRTYLERVVLSLHE